MKKLYHQAGQTLSLLLQPFLKRYLARTVRVRVVVVNDQKECLLVRGWLGEQKWSLPGGGIKRGEAPELTAVRETAEETGVVLFRSELVDHGIVESGPGETLKANYHVFSAHGGGKAKVPRAARLEILETGWFPIDHLPTPIYPLARRLIQQLTS